MSQETPAGWYPDDQGTLRYWDGGKWTQQTRTPGLGPVAPTEVKNGGALAKLKKAASDRSADRREAKEAQERERAAIVSAAGALVTSGTFGTSTIEIYEGGFVRVSTSARNEQPTMGNLRANLVSDSRGGKVPASTPYEKLRSIKFTASESEQASQGSPGLETVIGPAVANLLKGTKHLVKTSAPGLAAAGIAHVASQGARTCYLTIVTDRQIHTLSNQVLGSLGVKIAQKGHVDVGRALAAAGDSVLSVSDSHGSPDTPDRAALSEHSVAPETAPTGLASRLRELAALHQEGILSDDEFTSAKATLLNGL